MLHVPIIITLNSTNNAKTNYDNFIIISNCIVESISDYDRNIITYKLQFYAITSYDNGNMLHVLKYAKSFLKCCKNLILESNI